jgi:hypothetical protein
MPEAPSVTIKRAWFAAIISLVAQGPHAADHTIHAFKKLQLTDKFWAEGVAIGDINRDGHTDVISGPYWYEGPDFRTRHLFFPATQTFLRRGANGKAQLIRGFEGALGKKTSYSNNFFTFVYDFNRDGWPDILTIGFPGTAAIWYENPGNEGLKNIWETLALSFFACQEDSSATPLPTQTTQPTSGYFTQSLLKATIGGLHTVLATAT